MALFLTHLLLSFGMVAFGYFVMTKRVAIGAMAELLAVLFFAMSALIIFATVMDLWSNRKVHNTDQFMSGDDD